MITFDDIKKLKLSRHFPEGWEGSTLDLLKFENCPLEDRIFLAVNLCDTETKQQFMAWCLFETITTGEAHETEDALTYARLGSADALAYFAAEAAGEVARKAARERQLLKLLELEKEEELEEWRGYDF